PEAGTELGTPLKSRISLPTVDSANRRWPTWRVGPWGSSRSSSAWLGRSQKDGLPPAAEELTSGSRPSTRAQGRGSLVAAPFDNGGRLRSPLGRAAFTKPQAWG